jgi:hypothetical protein
MMLACVCYVSIIDSRPRCPSFKNFVYFNTNVTPSSIHRTLPIIHRTKRVRCIEF